ncbi:hypothetical protein LMH87_001083 [Akanthomyces muscarius]|uniref:Lipase n=1 Tax=Akanthomyces muscarius TaxID=2231603 RepID=A0A9W8QIN2_AKAMU|nr:hypothetical protein LMH87_001083 [Akanthomyces muscarius]KAJ4155858.1 hypothetical protein LMH87_001083 [Akanthomyces muscarius]
MERLFPSITLQRDLANIASVTSQYGLLWVMSALEKGWVVSVPDHEGPNAAFGAGILAGQGTLDSIRVALQSKTITRLLSDAKIALWGYSGGALAAEWALEIKQQYAPELKITAAAIGGELKDHFRPNASAIYDVTRQCTIPTIVEFGYKNFWDYIDSGDELLDDPYLQKIFAQNKMGNLGTSKVPTYMYHAINDELLPFQNIQDLYEKYCSAGANIQFSEEVFGEHIIVALTGAAGALGYLIDRVDGKAAPVGCHS